MIRSFHGGWLIPSINNVISVDALLSARPERLSEAAVAVWSAPVTLPTYMPETPDRYPAYLDQRVYQGSSGKVFPLPFIDRISEQCDDHEWVGLHLENDYLRLLVLPELGGRIHLALDKRTGSSLFFANPELKPALVGLAGPWLAGGVEFNWPQHHRPATFLPVAWEIDEDAGTVWCSDHDPFARMKGMHGVRLRAQSTVIDLQVRLHNRSDESQTFLWWANVAAEVHADYQSFFPDDVTMVADHAKRAVTSFPAADRSYYGIDYPARRDHETHPDSLRRVPGDRLDWSRNIPVPTSYMCVGSRGDFFGGYDHRTQSGFVHWADHTYAVGKKQWTWGDEPFGRRWNRNLADNGAAYIELMAGVYTDNQPDFSHLAPGETKAFTQHWYPLAGTGPAVAATLALALGVEVADRTTLRFDATEDLGDVDVSVADESGTLRRETFALSPTRRPDLIVPTAGPITVSVRRGDVTLLEWRTPSSSRALADIEPAREPLPPARIGSVEELYLVGRHLEQYRHATRSPEPYWAEGLTRDPGHAGTHTALAARRYSEGLFDAAETHCRAAIERLTKLNPNPETGDAHYLMGLALVRQGRDVEAYEAFGKATWLDAWVAAGSLQMAIIDARHGRDEHAWTRLRAALAARPDQLQSRDLGVVVLRRLGRSDEADSLLAETLALDPLDAWARYLAGTLANGLMEAQTLIDVGIEAERVGEFAAADELYGSAVEADASRPLGQTACAVLAGYHRAACLDRVADHEGAARARAAARVGDRTWNFASRLDDVVALEAALAADPQDATAAALLGHWLYAHGRQDEAMARWQASATLDSHDPVVWRNLGVAAYNVARAPETAVAMYQKALAVAPYDARLIFEHDQLLQRVSTPLAERAALLAAASDQVTTRDDLTVAYAHSLISTDRPQEALRILTERRFQPWEGGEGEVLRAWERAHLALADQAFAAGDGSAVALITAAIDSPESLGESRHPLANPAQLLLALGDAHSAAGHDDRAVQSWQASAAAIGDFSSMSPQAYSENTYYSVIAARRLGHDEVGAALIAGLDQHVAELVATPATIDYFATSLPTLLLFHDDPQRLRDIEVDVLRAQLAALDGDLVTAVIHLDAVLSADPGHALALDLRRRLSSTRSAR